MSRSNQNDRIVGELALGTAKLLVGDLAGARCHLEQVLTGYSATVLGEAAVRFDDVIRFQYEGRVESRAFLSGVLWLQGFPDQAIRLTETNLIEAQAIGHVHSRCLALALGSCRLALWTGDLGAAAHHVRLLADLSTEHGLHSSWGYWAARYRRVIALKSGNVGSMEEIDPSEANLRSLSVGIELVEALAKAGRSAEGLAMLDQFVAQTPELGSFTPEFLRVRGEILLLQATPATAGPSEELFRQALDVARRHGALSLELRAATSLARLLRDRGRQAEAIVCLQGIYDRFTEGFDTVDLIAAKHLLDELNGAKQA